MPRTVNSTVNTSPFFAVGEVAGRLVNGGDLAVREGGGVELAASCASLSNQRQIVFFGVMLRVLLVPPWVVQLTSELPNVIDSSATGRFDNPAVPLHRPPLTAEVTNGVMDCVRDASAGVGVGMSPGDKHEDR